MFITRLKPKFCFDTLTSANCRAFSRSTIFRSSDDKDEEMLCQDVPLTAIKLDNVNLLMSEGDEDLALDYSHYPNISIDRDKKLDSLKGHNLVVVQPWSSFANFDEFTDPDLQLAECVSLGNTLHNWRVIGKRVIFAKHVNKKDVFGRKAFEEFKDFVFSHKGVSALLFGVENLSGVQLATLENGLKLPCYDRFTMVLNIFRQHARTKEAKIQIALAELPYIRSHLREIHESSEFSSASESLKSLVGGMGDKYYHQRLDILKKRQTKLLNLLKDIRAQRDIIKKKRLKEQMPTISVVGYTNSGKTSLIKYLTNDPDLKPKDSLFATLDVTVHAMKLPSFNQALLVDTVGFISRIPNLLIGAFSATLRDVQDSHLILHVLDVTHPDFKLQYSTVINALKSLAVSKKLLDTKITLGNKVDLVSSSGCIPKGMVKCDFQISATEGTNMNEVAREMDARLSENMDIIEMSFKVDNGGKEYNWLRRNGSMLACEADLADGNYLICRVRMNKQSFGRHNKQFGSSSRLEEVLSPSKIINNEPI